MKKPLTLLLSLVIAQFALGQAETITDNAQNLSILKLKNTKWICDQTTALEFWNGGLKNYPTSRIVSKMDGCGTQGEALIFETETAGDTSPSAKMIIKHNGYVGIGNINPSARLDLSDVNADLSILKLRNGKWTCNQRTSIEFWNGGLKNHPTSRIVSQMDGCGTEGEALLFETQTAGETSPSAKMVIKNNGNIGIGISNPDSKLVVDGKIRSEEVKVEIINGPDYVFEEDYELRSLEDTKNYITKNKHLPEIPSAKEMEEDGIDLGAMNMKLLKKIEELTLYQIEIMEEMKQMKKELQALKE